jgi:peptide/nickel transport system substrate-binding protein
VSSPDGRNPLKDVRVRKALSLALNREALSQQVMSGMSTPAAELVAPGMFGATPGAQIDPYDPAEAKRLLAEAGYGNGFGLKLVTSNGLYVQDAQMAQAIAAMWTRVGVRTSVEAVPGSMFYARRAAKELSVFYTSSSMMTGQATDLLKVLLATRDLAKGMGQINFGGYSNPRMDSLLDEAGHTLDAAARQHMLEQASHIAIAEDHAALPIHIEKLGYAVRKPLSYTPRLDKGFTAMQIRSEAP